MPKPWTIHECDGPVVDEFDSNDQAIQKRQCTTCNEIWVASIVNLAAVRSLNFTKEKPMPDTRHPAVIEIMKYFKYEHLPLHLQEVSKPICELAEEVSYSCNGAELTAGLRKLLEAKDCFVRAAIK